MDGLDPRALYADGELREYELSWRLTFHIFLFGRRGMRMGVASRLQMAFAAPRSHDPIKRQICGKFLQ